MSALRRVALALTLLFIISSCIALPQLAYAHAAKGFLSRPVSEWSVSDVALWLSDRGLGAYAPSFIRQGVDGQSLMRMADVAEEGASAAAAGTGGSASPLSIRALLAGFDDDRPINSPSAWRRLERELKQLQEQSWQTSSSASASTSHADLLQKPLSQWSRLDAIQLLDGINMGRWAPLFVSEGIDGPALMHMDTSALERLMGLNALSGEEHKEVREELGRLRLELARVRAAQHDLPAEPLTDRATRYREEADELDRLQREHGAISGVPDRPQSAQCSREDALGMLPEEVRIFVTKLIEKLAREPSTAPSSPSPAADVHLPSNDAGCQHMLSQVVPPNTAHPGKVILVLGDPVAQAVDLSSWTNATLIYAYTNAPPVDAQKGDGWSLPRWVSLPVNPSIAVCAFRLAGLEPDAVLVLDDAFDDVWTSGKGEGDEKSSVDWCSCSKEWFSWPRGVDGKPGPTIIGELRHHRPYSALNSLAVRAWKRRVYVNGTCYAVQPPTPSSSSPFTCNDDYGDGLLPADVPLLTAYMAVEPSKSVDALQGRVESSLESFAELVDNLYIANLVDDSSDMELSSRIYSMLRSALSDHPRLRASRLASWRPQAYDNNYSKMRHAILKVLAGRTDGFDVNAPSDTVDLPGAKAGRFKSLYVLQVNPGEVVEDAAALRMYVRRHKHLCGPSFSNGGIALSILTNSTRTHPEVRLMGQAVHRDAKWEPNYPTEPHTWHYASTSNERYVNRDAREPNVYESMAEPTGHRSIPITGRLSSLTPAEVEDGCVGFGISRPTPPFMSVDKLMRDVGHLMAQEAELRAKMAWWIERYPDESTRPPMPRRWTVLLAHTLETLAALYERNKQLPESYEYNFRLLEHLAVQVGMAPHPLQLGFDATQVHNSRLQHALATVRLSEAEQFCSTLHKLSQLHVAGVNYTDLDATLRDSLPSESSFSSLATYYSNMFQTHCTEVLTEAVYASVAAQISSPSNSMTMQQLSRAEAMLSHAVLARDGVGRRNGCRLDRNVCRKEIPRAFRELTKKKEELNIKRQQQQATAS